MKSFARVTKLSNITGRADYISNEKRQENIVAKSTPVDWKPYHEYEVAHQKTAQRNNEGREVVIALPNAWATLPRAEISEKAHRLAFVAAEKQTALQWAVHWNKEHTNLHLHVIFSERSRTQDAGMYDRDIYLTNDGTVARRKADRAKDEVGHELPPVHRKGELKDGFTAKDTRYKARSWVEEVKENLWQELTRMGAQLEPQEILHQYHEGKGTDAHAIKEKNKAVKIGNVLLKQAQTKYGFSDELMGKIKRHAVKIVKQGKVPLVIVKDEKVSVSGITLERLSELRNQNREPVFDAVAVAKQLHAAQQDYLKTRTDFYEFRSAAVPVGYMANKQFARDAHAIRAGIDKYKNLESHSKELIAQKGSLGIFDRKKKKEIDAQIAHVWQQQQAVKKEIEEHGVGSSHATDEIFFRVAERTAIRFESFAYEESNKEHAASRGIGVHERTEAAERRFAEIAGEIPQAQRKDVLDAMRGLQGSFNSKEKSTLLAKVDAEKLILKSFGSPTQDRKQVHDRSRSSGHER